MKLALAGSAGEVVLAVNASKLGHRAPARAFGLDRVDVLVTELDPTDPRLDPYRRHARVL